ncbi:MAG: phytoene/squalene synthase family protein [Acidimicrobiales bacterium]
MNLDEAYEACEEVTRSRARNFSYGIRLLPMPKRRAMSALYATARRIDDVGDGLGSAADKLRALAKLRKELDAVATDPRAGGDDPILVALADACRRYPIPMAALDELIEGCEMDVHGRRYETFEDLVGYCRRVAGTIGRMSLGIDGPSDPDAAEPLANTLGVALQLTNILRDIVEDRDSMGRIYLPAEDIARFGALPDLSGPPDAMSALICHEAGRAEVLYEEGLHLLPYLDRRSRACTAAMAGIYRQLLRHIQREPLGVLDRRMSLPTWHKAAVAARALALGAA